MKSAHRDRATRGGPSAQPYPTTYPAPTSYYQLPVKTASSPAAEGRPHWQELSPEWRYVIGTAVLLKHYLLKMVLLFGIGWCVFVMVDAAVNERYTAYVSRSEAVVEAVAGFYADDFYQPVKQPGAIANFPITSNYGMRRHPITGEYKFHAGADLSTPIGTNVYAINARLTDVTTVLCKGSAAAKSGTGLYAEFTTTAFPGMKFRSLHLSKCAEGRHMGQRVAIAQTGNSGSSTGPHLHFEQYQDDSLEEPQRGYLQWHMTGVAPKESLKDATRLYRAFTDDDPSLRYLPRPVGPWGRFSGWVSRNLFGPRGARATRSDQSISDELLKRTICRAEGTCEPDGTPNDNYASHTDPGNRRRNQGFFSYQHGAANPQAADQKQLARLRAAEREYRAQSRAKWGGDCSRACMVVWLDAFNQSPGAAGFFIKYLKTADPTPEELVWARTLALEESRRVHGAPGAMDVAGDQRRRVEEILQQLVLVP